MKSPCRTLRTCPMREFILTYLKDIRARLDDRITRETFAVSGFRVVAKKGAKHVRP